MKKNIVLICFIAFSGISICGFSQKSSSQYIDAVIITAKDTILCSVENRNTYAGNITYTINDETKEMNANNIIQLKTLINTYDNIFYLNKQYLMKCLAKGTVSLYEYTSTEDSYGTGFDGGTGDNESEPTFYFLMRDGVLYKISRKSYITDIQDVLTRNVNINNLVNRLLYEEIKIILPSIIERYNKEL